MRQTKDQEQAWLRSLQPIQLAELAGMPSIDQPPTRTLQIQALILAGLSPQEVAVRLDIRISTVRGVLKQLFDGGENLKTIQYLAKFFVDHSIDGYKTYMEKAGEIADLLATWDRNAVSRLVEDLRSGKLAQQYAAAAEPSVPAAPSDRSSPPGGQLYAARTNRRESAPQFIERVYGGAGWLTGEFTRADLRKLDSAAVVGLENWERKNGRTTVNLPTQKERTDRELSIPGVEERARVGARLRTALWRRGSP